MDEVEELNRRIKSQQQTLEDLVKKNLDMEMEINLKNFEIRSIRGR
jgi:cell division protein FtsB